MDVTVDDTGENEAAAHWSSILGGYKNVAGDDDPPIDRNMGKYSAIGGGESNNTTGESSFVCGDHNITVSTKWGVGGC